MFAEQTIINFADYSDEMIMVSTNTSQKTKNKRIKNSGSSIQVFTEVPFSGHANTMSVVFIEPIKIENVSSIKEAKITGKSLGYNATVILHFMTSKGDLYKVEFKDAIKRIPGEYELSWKNSSYIEDVRDRNPVLKPIWPFNDSDMYLYEVEYHQNECITGFPFNAQELISLEIIYDKDTIDGNELKNSFEETFGVEEKIKTAQSARSEKLKAEKKAAEDREKALMATE